MRFKNFFEELQAIKALQGNGYNFIDYLGGSYPNNTSYVIMNPEKFIETFGEEMVLIEPEPKDTDSRKTLYTYTVKIDGIEFKTCISKGAREKLLAGYQKREVVS